MSGNFLVVWGTATQKLCFRSFPLVPPLSLISTCPNIRLKLQGSCLPSKQRTQIQGDAAASVTAIMTQAKAEYPPHTNPSLSLSLSLSHCEYLKFFIIWSVPKSTMGGFLLGLPFKTVRKSVIILKQHSHSHMLALAHCLPPLGWSEGHPA